MKKIIFLLISIISITSYGQTKTASVEKSIFGVQTGLLGIWVHNESKLATHFSLKSELGLDMGIGNTFFDKKTTYASVFSFTLEPRYYYNLNKRLEKNKKITKNSGNYIALKTTFNPDWFIISNKDHIDAVNQMRTSVFWGIKRTYGVHFTLETGAGLGLFFTEFETNQTGIDLHFRIGYTF